MSLTSSAVKKSERTSLHDMIETRQARVGIIGLGYVGLPLAVEFANNGFSVIGFEVDPSRIQMLLKGESYIADVPAGDLKTVVEKRRFTATTNFGRLKEADAIIICVPTPLNKTKDPDISYIASATEKIAKNIRPHQLIVLESTTYPGTTREYMLPILQRVGGQVGKDFYLAFSPERIDPANQKFKVANTPKVVGGITPVCGSLASLLYSQVVDQVVPVSSADAAEMVKILENTFRAVNIGLVNEIAMICSKLKLNVWEVIDAASTKPYGYMPFYPGPGLGGHCIPIDPHYLSWKMKALNFPARFIELAGEVNSHMPDFVVEKTAWALNDRKKAVNGSKILVMGVTYKADVCDTRESPALEVIHLLQKRGADVSICDPFVDSVDVEGHKLVCKPYSAALLKNYDAVVVTTAHKAFDAKEIVAHAPLLIDTRNMTKGITAPNVVLL